MIRLASLAASSIRGLPRHWENLAIPEGGMIIYGPNGSGKSSVIDAIEYALTNKSSLFERNRAGVNWESAAPHVKDGNPDVVIEIGDGKDTYPIRLGQDTTALPGHIGEWLRLAQCSSFVLRRYMLLHFIEADPANRYASVDPFLNLATYLPIEEALKTWIDGLDTQIGIADANINTICQKIRAIFKLDQTCAIEEMGLMRVFNAKLAEANLAECQSENQLGTCAEVLAEKLGDKSVTHRLEILGDLKGQAQRLILPNSLCSLLDQLIVAQVCLETEMADINKVILGEFLIEAKELIELNAFTVCPICEQNIDAKALIERLKLRIEADRRIIDAKALVRKRKETLLGQSEPLIAAITTFKNAWQESIQLPFPEEYVDTQKRIEAMTRLLRSNEVRVVDLRPYDEWLSNLDKLVKMHEKVLGILDGLIVDEGGGSHRTLLLDAKAMVECMCDDVAKLRRVRDERQACESQRDTIAVLHKHSVDARKYAVQITLDSVANTANDMYKQIHQDEGIAKSRLSVRDAARASVILTNDFCGKEENPLLHHSESHLDTLGLCYFMALRRCAAEQEPRFKILVLDDVLHSVDAEHRQRVCKLLKDNFSDHQIIVTTHDPVFYERLRETLGGARLKYIRFTTWDISHGPVLSDPNTDIDRICDEGIRSSKSPEELAMACGRFTEMLLRRLTESLVVSVPARFESRYTINDLWPPLFARLGRHKGFAAANSGLADKINNDRWVRNECGAHYNNEPIPPTPAEIRELAESLAGLYSATYCNKCGKYISRQPNGDWRCACGTGGLAYIS